MTEKRTPPNELFAFDLSREAFHTENKEKSYRFVGDDNCRYIYQGILTRVEWIAYLSEYHFPDRKDKFFWVGDGCKYGFQDNCPNHPIGSHTKWSAFDFNYMTFAELSWTQYKPAYGLITPIWKDNQNFTKNDLLLDVFDVKRNAFIVVRLCLYFPTCKLILNDVIWKFIRDALSKKSLKLVQPCITTSKKDNLLHHTHGHCGV